MITIFSTPRAFEGVFDTIQRNAIKSWMELVPKCQIILFDDEKGTTAKVAKEYGLLCIKKVKRNKYGTMMMNDIFQKAGKFARFSIMAHVNTDIILLENFLDQIKKVGNIKHFLMVGRRWNLKLRKVNYNNPEWEEKLINKIESVGVLHPPSGMDYWVFPRNQIKTYRLPAFVIGRPCIDSWLVYRSRFLRYPVIDSTSSIKIIHQQHPTPKNLSPEKVDPVWKKESEYNLLVGGGYSKMFTLNDADWELKNGGLCRPNLSIQRIQRMISTIPVLYPEFAAFYNFFASLLRLLKNAR